MGMHTKETWALGGIRHYKHCEGRLAVHVSAAGAMEIAKPVEKASMEECHMDVAEAMETYSPGQQGTRKSPGHQGQKRNAQGHKERSASAERRIAERMVELEARFEANRKLRGPEHVSKPLPNPNLGAYPYHCGAPDRWG